MNLGEPRETFKDDLEEISNISFKNRLLGFSTSVFLGVFFAVISYASISVGHIRMFAIFYSLTNFIFICGTGFIVGPVKQFELMFTPERIISSLIYLTATIAVILTGLKKKLVMCSILFFVQVISLIWYTLSYVPYAQEVVSKLFGL